MSRSLYSRRLQRAIKLCTIAILTATVLIALLCISTACLRSPQSKSKSDLGIDGQALSFPAEWPLADLRPPPGSGRAYLLNPVTNDPYAQILPFERSVRCDIGYTNELGFESNLDHIKSELAKYSEFTEASQSDNAAYLFSVKDSIEVGLVYRHYTGGDVYQLFVTALK